MTTTDQPAAKVQDGPDAQSPGAKNIVGGTITGLNPVDGLFLKAEHLQRMQRYASDLVGAAGAGLGFGVAFGFKCTLSHDNDAVQITGGLAFAAGRPLRSSEPATVSLQGLSTAVNEFWVVEIVPSTWEYGSEPVYGGLCEDPCGHGSGIRPYLAEGIEVRLRRDSFDNFADPENKRNKVASRYFERERKFGGEMSTSPNAPWLMPINGSVDEIGDNRPWEGGTSSYEYDAVPLGVVWRDGGVWNLDVWTARRDLGDPTPVAAWQWRLGWRPRSVFIAQVLQFQAQVAGVDFGRPQDLSPKDKLVLEQCEKLLLLARESRANISDGVKVVAGDVQSLLVAKGLTSLRAAGFDELPPAGYLPLDFRDIDESAAQDFFGGEVDVRIRPCRADYIAHAFEEAQHMDRIPLRNHVGPKPEIDLLLPQPGLVDLTATSLDVKSGYGWAAFVRRRDDLVAVPARDPVEVYLCEIGSGDRELPKSAPPNAKDRDDVLEKLERWLGRREPRFKPIGLVSYPEAEWGVPVLPEDVSRHFDDLRAEQMKRCVGVVGVAGSDDRLPLAAARAALLVTPVHGGGGGPVDIPPTFTVTAPGIAPELIVIVLTERDR